MCYDARGLVKVYEILKSEKCMELRMLDNWAAHCILNAMQLSTVIFVDGMTDEKLAIENSTLPCVSEGDSL